MASRDYILRYLELVRQFLAQAVKLRESGKLNEALRVLLQAQEKLFARPASEFVTLGVDEQLRMLARGESPENARAKRVGYAALIQEAARVYRERDRDDLAAAANQLALHIMLTVALEQPDEADALLPSIRELLAQVPPEQLYEPVKELLVQIGEIPARTPGV
jgi:hypothetical protein